MRAQEKLDKQNLAGATPDNQLETSLLCAGCLTVSYQLLHPRQHQWREESADRDGRSSSGGRRVKSGTKKVTS